jgi:hypothetical protein
MLVGSWQVMFTLFNPSSRLAGIERVRRANTRHSWRSQTAHAERIPSLAAPELIGPPMGRLGLSCNCAASGDSGTVLRSLRRRRWCSRLSKPQGASLQAVPGGEYQDGPAV